jgi:hypothetical protein
MSLQYIHKYSIAEYTTIKDGKMLLKDGQPCKCHKVGPTIVPNRLTGDLSPVYEHCTTHCTRALIAVEEDGKLAFVQTCEVQAQKFPLENAEAKSKIEAL